MTNSSTETLLISATDSQQNIISRPTNTTHDQENPKPTPDQTNTQDLSLVTNEDFLSGIFPTVEDGTFVAVCTKTGDPDEDFWIAKRAMELFDIVPLRKDHCINANNNLVLVGVLLEYFLDV